MSRHPGKPTDEEQDSAAEAFYDGFDPPVLRVRQPSLEREDALRGELQRLRDGLATLPRYDLRIEADQGRVFIDSWKDEDGEWIKRADVAALLTEKT